MPGDANEQTPPDLPSNLFKERIVYMGMSLVPAVTELMLAELLYLQYDNPNKPIFLYINSAGAGGSKGKLGYEAEAFAVYDTMRYIKPDVYTICVGNAFGEAAMLLAARLRVTRVCLGLSPDMLTRRALSPETLRDDREVLHRSLIKDRRFAVLATGPSGEDDS